MKAEDIIGLGMSPCGFCSNFAKKDNFDNIKHYLYCSNIKFTGNCSILNSEFRYECFTFNGNHKVLSEQIKIRQNKESVATNNTTLKKNEDDEPQQTENIVDENVNGEKVNVCISKNINDFLNLVKRENNVWLYDKEYINDKFCEKFTLKYNNHKIDVIKRAEYNPIFFNFRIDGGIIHNDILNKEACGIFCNLEHLKSCTKFINLIINLNK